MIAPINKPINKPENKPGNLLDMFQENELDLLLNFVFPPANAREFGQGKPERADEIVVSFLDACLANMGWSRQDLAKNMMADLDRIDSLMDGLLPEGELDHELLADLAHAVGYEPEVLEMMMEYSESFENPTVSDIIHKMAQLAITGVDYPDKDRSEIKSQIEELDALQKQLANLLIEGVGGYYNAESANDNKQQILYRGVINAIRSAVANYQSDIDEAKKIIDRVHQNYRNEVQAIQSMVAQLKVAYAFERIMQNEDAQRIIPLQDKIIQFIEKL